MATISNVRSINATLSTTTVDVARLLQYWDHIEVTNLDGTNALVITDDGATNPSAGLEGAIIIPPSQTKVLPARALSTTAPDGSAVICHEIRVLGNGGSYQVCGIQNQG